MGPADRFGRITAFGRYSQEARERLDVGMSAGDRSRANSTGQASVLLTLDDAALERLAELVVERLAPTLAASQTADCWLTTSEAAEYLGLPSSSQLHKMSAARAVPFHQDRPGGRLYFKRSELDRWRAA